MPTIRIDYDDTKINEKDILDLSHATQKIVHEITKIDDTFVFANSPHIKIKTAPIEIYIQITASKIKNIDDLHQEIKTRLSNWKKETHFKHPINLTLMPMEWRFDIDI